MNDIHLPVLLEMNEEKHQQVQSRYGDIAKQSCTVGPENDSEEQIAMAFGYSKEDLALSRARQIWAYAAAT